MHFFRSNLPSRACFFSAIPPRIVEHEARIEGAYIRIVNELDTMALAFILERNATIYLGPDVGENGTETGAHFYVG